MLIPRIKSIPFFRGSAAADNRRQEYERYHCGEYYYGVENRKNVPDICKQYDVSIGFYAYGGAYRKIYFYTAALFLRTLNVLNI